MRSVAILAFVLSASHLQAEPSLRAATVEALSAESLRSLHDLVASEPNYAGSPGGQRNGDRIAAWFATLGLGVEVQELDVYLPQSGRGAVTITAPERIELPIGERKLAEDPFTGIVGAAPPMNGYSASGVVESEVVYANRGRKEDFELLAEMGVPVEGRIVLARYGGNYRGQKARFAQLHGAAGLIIFSDPADSGFGRGPEYPEGGFANDSSVERGSILALPYPGDPLSPGWAATPGAPHLNPDDVALPRIPVQPIGWGAAQRILERMRGEHAPEEWQGGLDLEYRLTGGEALRVQLEVEQPVRHTRVSNVLARLSGATRPEEVVIIGCHRDAWIHGAHDPHSGLIVVLEAARVFAEAAKNGLRPERTILFAAWDAEEHGIIGSTEWVEANEQSLLRHAVAYINLDAASFGPSFRASASPSLRPLIERLARETAHPLEDEFDSVLESWAGDRPEPRFGDQGGGSDHDAFVNRVGVPCASLGAGGAQGIAYHSAYDTLSWYRKVVGEDYASAHLVAKMAVSLAAELAASPSPPLEPASTARVFSERMRTLAPRLTALGAPEARVDAMLSRADALAARAAAAVSSLHTSRSELVTEALIACDRAWLDDRGLPDREWRRNLLIAPDEDSGYAAWPLPALRWVVERGRPDALDAELTRYEQALDRFERAVGRLEALTADPMQGR